MVSDIGMTAARDLPRVTRRRFATVAGGTLASLAFGACRGSAAEAPSDGRLTARPKAGVTTSASGTHPLGLESGRDAILQMPAGAPGSAVPLLLLLHGAGGSAEGILRRLGRAAGDAGVAVLAPDSRAATWDAIRGNFGPDITYINRALDRVFQTVAVDPSRVAVGGFSDGASYAVSLGVINGDLFGRAVAFSPGFVIEREAHGTPTFFISHGTEDPILPIDPCGRAIAASLRRRKYEVTLREFHGGHEIPPEIAAEGMKWIAAA